MKGKKANPAIQGRFSGGIPVWGGEVGNREQATGYREPGGSKTASWRVGRERLGRERGYGVGVEGDGAAGSGPATEAVFDGAAGTPAAGRVAAHGAQGTGNVGGGDGQGFAGEPVGGVSNGAVGVERHDHAGAAGQRGAGNGVPAGVFDRTLPGGFRGAGDSVGEAVAVEEEGFEAEEEEVRADKAVHDLPEEGRGRDGEWSAGRGCHDSRSQNRDLGHPPRQNEPYRS